MTNESGCRSLPALVYPTRAATGIGAICRRSRYVRLGVCSIQFHGEVHVLSGHSKPRNQQRNRCKHLRRRSRHRSKKWITCEQHSFEHREDNVSIKCEKSPPPVHPHSLQLLAQASRPVTQQPLVCFYLLLTCRRHRVVSQRAIGFE